MSFFSDDYGVVQEKLGDLNLVEQKNSGANGKLLDDDSKTDVARDYEEENNNNNCMEKSDTDEEIFNT